MNGGFNPIKDSLQDRSVPPVAAAPQHVEARRARWAGRRRDAGESSSCKAADGGAARESEGSGPRCRLRLARRAPCFSGWSSAEPIAAIVAAGFDRDTVLRVDRILNLAEYKRRQAAPGVKVTLRSTSAATAAYPDRQPDSAIPAPAAAAGRRRWNGSRESGIVRLLAPAISLPLRVDPLPCWIVRRGTWLNGPSNPGSLVSRTRRLRVGSLRRVGALLRRCRACRLGVLLGLRQCLGFLIGHDDIAGSDGCP